MYLTACCFNLEQNERVAYEVVVEEGRLLYKQSGDLVNTNEESKWIFVLSTSRSLYVGQKRKGKFQHSSFLSGAATSAAGRLVAKEGVLKAIWPYSGHYLPTEENFREFITFLEDNNVDLANVKVRNESVISLVSLIAKEGLLADKMFIISDARWTTTSTHRSRSRRRLQKSSRQQRRPPQWPPKKPLHTLRPWRTNKQWWSCPR